MVVMKRYAETAKPMFSGLVHSISIVIDGEPQASAKR
jgi:hypothetical protein